MQGSNLKSNFAPEIHQPGDKLCRSSPEEHQPLFDLPSPLFHLHFVLFTYFNPVMFNLITLPLLSHDDQLILCRVKKKVMRGAETCFYQRATLL